jgi:hypothetical protein
MRTTLDNEILDIITSKWLVSDLWQEINIPVRNNPIKI